MNIIVMGSPGSGKSTQTELLAKKLGLPHIETGEIYRQLAEMDTPLGKKVKEIMKNGGLLDDETTFEVVDKHFAEFGDGFVLDGFPRTISQAQRELVKVDRVFYLKISDEVATRRLLSRGRENETAEVISERLAVFHKETEPILEYYRLQGKLIEVDGNLNVPEINNRILRKL